MKLAFSVTRNTTWEVASSNHRVTFDKVLVNDGDAFDITASHFIVPHTGLYWIHVSVGIPTNTSAYVTVHGTQWPIDIIRYHSTFNVTPSVTSRDALVQLEAGAQLWLTSNSSIYSDELYMTSFNGFLLNTIVVNNILTAFSVGKSKSQAYNCSNMLENDDIVGKVTFDVTHIDTHDAWNTTGSEYIAPVNGTYIVSLTSGIRAFTDQALRVSGGYCELNLCGVLLSHTGADYQEDDVISSTFVMPMTAGDRLYIGFQCVSGARLKTVHSEGDFQTTLAGFIYAPHVRPVCWMLVFARSYELGTKTVEEPLLFRSTMRLNDLGWTVNKYLYRDFVTPGHGIYYIHMSLTILYHLEEVEQEYLSSVKLELIVNGSSIGGIQHIKMVMFNSTTVTSSKTIIARLKLNDRMHAKLTKSRFVKVRGRVIGFRMY